MTGEFDSEGIVAAAIAVLPEIVAALDPPEQPPGGSWVAVTVYSGQGEAGVPHRSFYTWRYDAPPEPLEERRYLDLTRDEKTGVIKVPVWTFELTPLGDDEWLLGSWFAAPLRIWLGEQAGDRVKGQGLCYRARRKDDGWTLEVEDILAG